VTNAVQAVTGLGGAAGPPPIRLRLTRRDHGIQAEVWDGSDELPDPLRTRSADEPGGWGLILVDALSSRWGTYRTVGGGKCAWAIISP
jgi:serine/threonine-protein kinase RsbW